MDLYMFFDKISCQANYCQGISVPGFSFRGLLWPGVIFVFRINYCQLWFLSGIILVVVKCLGEERAIAYFHIKLASKQHQIDLMPWFIYLVVSDDLLVVRHMINFSLKIGLWQKLNHDKTYFVLTFSLYSQYAVRMFKTSLMFDKLPGMLLDTTHKCIIR